jgi:hypothetical protein
MKFSAFLKTTLCVLVAVCLSLVLFYGPFTVPPAFQPYDHNRLLDVARFQLRYDQSIRNAEPTGFKVYEDTKTGACFVVMHHSDYDQYAITSVDKSVCEAK